MWVGAACESWKAIDRNNIIISNILIDLPYKIFAMRAESGLLEKSRNEFVVFDIVNISLLKGAFSASQA